MPRIIFSAKLTELSGLDPAVMSSASSPYVLAHIGGRRFGRSKAVAPAATTVNLAAEPAPWELDVVTESGTLPLKFEVWDDHGDGAPTLLVSGGGDVTAPPVPGEVVVGAGPMLKAIVEARPVPKPADKLYVPRVPDGSKLRAKVVIPTSLVLDVAQIRGLFQPVATGAPGRERSKPAPAGYHSEDHLGRVFLNQDLDGKWKKDTQLVEVAVKVTPTRGAIPADCKVRWTLVDVDDPVNDDPGFHHAWGPYVDKKDYDGAGKQKGAAGDDNEGPPAKSPPWEEVAGFALSAKTAKSAKTAVVKGESKVTLHCPSRAGDNFALKIDVEPSPGVESFAAVTGIITLWHRLDVENVKMKGGLRLPVEGVPVPFEPMCVQLDFAPEREVENEVQMAPSRDQISAASAAYVEKVFANKGKPGWFCVMSAMEPHPLPATLGEELFKGKGKLGSAGGGSDKAEYIEVAGDHAGADFANITFAGGEVGFRVYNVQKAGAITRLWLEAHDAQPAFTHGDGSHKHAYDTTYLYGPRFTIGPSGTKAGGYGMPEEVDVVVNGAGAFYVAGISPGIKRAGKDYFAGRTVMFTHHRSFLDPVTGGPKADYEPKMMTVIVHELVHAFGMPHKCAQFDFRTPRTHTCCMNYRPNWMVDTAMKLVPGSSGKTGPDVCGRHLKEVRRVQLQLNKGLRWGG